MDVLFFLSVQKHGEIIMISSDSPVALLFPFIFILKKNDHNFCIFFKWIAARSCMMW